MRHIGGDVPAAGIPLAVVTLEAELYAELVADALAECVLAAYISGERGIGLLEGGHTHAGADAVYGVERFLRAVRSSRSEPRHT